MRGGAGALRALALAAALAASLGAGAPPPDAGGADSAPTLQALMDGMAGTPGVVARFREEKELALLSAPLESRGILYFAPPDRLARIVETPGSSRLVIDGDRLRFRDDAGGEDVDLSQHAIAREYVSNFMVLFNGDLEALRARYTPTLRSEDGRWTLDLRPRHRPLSDFIDHVTLVGRGTILERMELLESDGDRTTTWFEDVEIRPFDAAESARIFALPAPSAGGSGPPEGP